MACCPDPNPQGLVRTLEGSGNGSVARRETAVENEIEPESLVGLTPTGGTSPSPSDSDLPAAADVPATSDLPAAAADLDLDLLSASIRADAADTDSFFKVLASKLADALGEKVQIKREGGMFKRDKAAVGITVDLASGAGVVLEATRKGGSIECVINRPVPRNCRFLQARVTRRVDRQPHSGVGRRGTPQRADLESAPRDARMNGTNQVNTEDPKSRPSRKATR